MTTNLMQISNNVAMTLNDELGINVEAHILTQQGQAGAIRMSVMGTENDCEKAARFLVEKLQATIEHEDRESDPEDPEFRSWRVVFPAKAAA